MGNFQCLYDRLDYMNIMGTGGGLSGLLTGRQSKYRTLTTPRSAGLRTLQLLLLLICCIIPSTQMTQEYEFRLGSNATITFNHRLSHPNTTYACEVFALGFQRPFFLNWQLDERSLKGSQRGRFEVNIDSSDNKINISLCIKSIQKEDSDVYIVNLRESFGGTEKNDIYEAYIAVTFPPGNADCNIHPSEYYDEWSEIHCHAESGSADGGGSLLCLQDGVRTPHLQPVQVDGGQLSAVFWVRTNSHISCCSAEMDIAVESGLCRDFIYVYRTLGVNISDTFTRSAGSAHITTFPTTTSTLQNTSMSDPNKISNSCLHRNTEELVLGVLLAVCILIPFIVFGCYLWYKRRHKSDIDRTPANDATIHNEELTERKMQESISFIENEHDGRIHREEPPNNTLPLRYRSPSKPK